MSTSVNLDTIVTDDGLRRDRWGRLMALTPEGDLVGHTRVTTIAKTTDNEAAIAPWKATMAVTGSLMRPGLRARWEALVAAHNGRPWYAGEDAKRACKELAEESADAGGAADRRQQGDALHALTARLDLGATSMPGLTAETEADLTAYVNTLVEAGVTIVAGMVETTVVLDGLAEPCGGSFDRLVMLAGRPLPMIADLKTGAELSYSWPSFAVQLAGYSRATAVYRQGKAPDGSLDERLPMPEVDQEVGLVIWLPAGEARCELHLVDLTTGWAGFELSLDVRAWRRRKAHLGRLAELTPQSTSAKIDSTSAAAATSTAPIETSNGVTSEPATSTPSTSSSGGSGSGAGASVMKPTVDEATALLRAWLQHRIDAVGAFSTAARDDLMRSWPVDVAPLGRSDDHTAHDLSVIERVLDDVEARHSVPFGPTKPSDEQLPDADRIARLLHVFPNTTQVPRSNEP